jgi:hypothetical protein
MFQDGEVVFESCYMLSAAISGDWETVMIVNKGGVPFNSTGMMGMSKCQNNYIINNVLSISA